MRAMQWMTAGAMLIAASAAAQPMTELGRLEYQSYCETCHGAQGRGDGPFAQYLKLPVPDLTGLARRQGGTFPADMVARTIDGRDALKGHGARQMPIWGARYNERAREQLPGTREEREAFTQERVKALVEHLRTLQRP
jgi:mono/diheme cytochrome c family protein